MSEDATAAPPPTATGQQVEEIVPTLPFEDDPSTFVRVMVELGQAHALEDEG